MTLKRYLFILMAIIVTFTLGCEREKVIYKNDGGGTTESVNPVDGTSDPGGGGDIRMSTQDEVIDAIKATISFLMSSKGQRFLNTHVKNALQKEESPDSQKLIKMLEKISPTGSWLNQNVGQDMTISQIKKKIANAKLTLMKNDTIERNCAHPGYETYPDAYTSVTGTGVEFCFNIQRLQRLTQDSLQTHLVSLWVHEISHLYGADEPLARALGDFVLRFTLKMKVPQDAVTFEAIFAVFKSIYQEIQTLKTALPSKNTRPLTEAEKRVFAGIVTNINILKKFDPFILSLDSRFAMEPKTPILTSDARFFVEQVQEMANFAYAIKNQADIGELQFSVNSFAVRSLDQELGCTVKRFLKLATAIQYKPTNSMLAEILLGQAGNCKN